MTRIIARVAFLVSLMLGGVASALANPPPPPPPPVPATAPAYIADRGVSGPSDHFCTEIQLPNGHVIPKCLCYGRLDCRNVRPACTAWILATNRNAVREGICVMPLNAPPKG